jgi:hypothetical protein
MIFGLYLKTKLATVCRLCHKTDRRMIWCGAPSRRLRRVVAEDGRVDAMGYVGPFYHKIIILYVFDPRGK